MRPHGASLPSSSDFLNTWNSGHKKQLGGEKTACCISKDNFERHIKITNIVFLFLWDDLMQWFSRILLWNNNRDYSPKSPPKVACTAFQTREISLREAKQVAQGHTAGCSTEQAFKSRPICVSVKFPHLRAHGYWVLKNCFPGRLNYLKNFSRISNTWKT